MSKNHTMSIFILLIPFSALKWTLSSAFPTHHRSPLVVKPHRPPSTSILLYNSKGSKKTPSADQVEQDMNPVAQASWYTVEAFGKLFSPLVSSAAGGQQQKQQLVQSVSVNTSLPPKSARETLERIRLDNDRQYFLSGLVDELIYDEDCVFSDPFVSFRGRSRFVENLKNLGSFITKYDSKVLQYNVSQDGLMVNTKIMVKLELNLPWKPILAWPWGVRYDISNETFLVTNHKESWDIEPLEGVKQIFRKPTIQVKRTN
eukprot:CAMPEP_0176493556 /NCGR_PEP_ID=MMETSP0200_2-20121128/9611_1 /TAXON_ID=947934 /ORGANISM="Chaetoceros sp., Strain GSL56" /LENGTH=258 /DNA_ID=CAMNT_0017891225 /DNA_START=98 /DNA_END=874 /DNA_ORIENTATION=+